MTTQDQLRVLLWRVIEWRALDGDGISDPLRAEILTCLGAPAGSSPHATPPQPVRDMGEATEDGDRICEGCNQQVPARHRCTVDPAADQPPPAVTEQHYQAPVNRVVAQAVAQLAPASLADRVRQWREQAEWSRAESKGGDYSDGRAFAFERCADEAELLANAAVPPAWPTLRDNGRPNRWHEYLDDPETGCCVICGWAEAVHVAEEAP